MLYTDGTGTGKSYSGLGVAYRYAMRGKDNILIVAPQDKVMDGWINSAANLGLPVRKLENTKDNGRSGIVTTTYANFGQNPELVKRKWDLVIMDEAHNLSTNKNGDHTLASAQLQAITMHPDGKYFRARMLLIEEHTELERLRLQLSATPADINNFRKHQELKDREQELLEEIRRKEEPILEEVDKTKPADRVRAVLLSATPFSYQKSVRYAQNWLFDWNEGFTERSGYNQPNAEQNFFITHLGWRMRTGKLTQPDVDVNSDIMEQELHEWLKKDQQSLSSHKLKIDTDYSRSFVLIQDAIGKRIDEGLEWLARAEDRRFEALYDKARKNFTYLKQMFLLESIKAKGFVPIIREQLAMGRKVLVAHDYIVGGGFHPFQFEGTGESVTLPDKSSITLDDLIAEFESKRPDLVNLDFSSLAPPIDTFRREFGDEAMFYNGRPQSEATSLDPHSSPQ